MKPEDIRGNTVEELAVLEGDLRRRLWKARFDNHTNQLDDTSTIQKLRRDLARVARLTEGDHAAIVIPIRLVHRENHLLAQRVRLVGIIGD